MNTILSRILCSKYYEYLANSGKPEVALGWDFLGIPNPRSPSRGLGMGIFHFGLDQKIPGDLKSRGWGSGILDPQKSPVKNPRKIPNPGDGDSGFLSPKNPQKIPK